MFSKWRQWLERIYRDQLHDLLVTVSMRGWQQWLPLEAITNATLGPDQIPVIPEHLAKGKHLNID